MLEAFDCKCPALCDNFLALESIEKNPKTTDKEKLQALRALEGPLATAMAAALESGMKSWSDYSAYVSGVGGLLDPVYGTLVHRVWIVANAYGDFLQGRLFWPAEAYAGLPCPCSLFHPSKLDGAMLALAAMVAEVREHASSMDLEAAPPHVLSALAHLDSLENNPEVFRRSVLWPVPGRADVETPHF